ncbi:phosphonate C-P lyase system protein PhnH [Marinobacter sp. 1Y8]
MTAISTHHLWVPFANPVLQSQQAFRKLMRAMSEPGTCVSFDTLYATDSGQASATSQTAAFATALTLLDQETSVWVSPGISSPALIDNLRFHCGCRLAENTSEADFVMLSLSELNSLDRFSEGEDINPHTSATLIVQVPALEVASVDDAHPDLLTLSGPGIKARKGVRVQGLTSDHRRLFEDNHQRYPLGVDFMLTCGADLVALPRSTRVSPVTNRAATAGEDTQCMSQ